MKKIITVLAVLISGVLIFFLGVFSNRIWGWNNSGTGKLTSILELVENFYVDSVNMDSIEELTIPSLLNTLDPHSVYLNASLNKRETEGLDGSFQGIGIQFNTIIDTVVVVRVIEGGASERAGLKAGDRIVQADTTQLIGENIPSELVLRSLKGPEGTIVHLKVKRGTEILDIPVVRGPVPVSSIDASYLIKPNILYVRLNKWGAITHQEFMNVFARFYSKGVNSILLDLRDNAGGYLESATALSSEFLPEGKTIVYTQGRKFPKEEFITQKDGLLKDIPLVVLVNEFSASSSEIFAGAIQDHDRALIIGRRTFGKGLVQRPFMLPDSSVIRLTVARYYTPSGRSLQKSYAGGTEVYEADILNRYKHGEFTNADSISVKDSTKFYTLGRRIVYGGGGVTPDIFIPRDSTGINTYYLRLMGSGTLPQYAFQYADKNREKLNKFTTVSELSNYLDTQGLLFDYAYYAQNKGIPIRTTMLQQSASLIMRNLKALIADNVSPDRNALFEILNSGDLEVIEGVTKLEQGIWKPLIKQH